MLLQLYKKLYRDTFYFLKLIKSSCNYSFHCVEYYLDVKNSYLRGMEQLVARRAHNPEVSGSNPLPAIF